MCHGDHPCSLKLLDPQNSSCKASSYICAEARKVLGRDVVLGVVSECSGPCGGKMMSSSALQPSALQTSATAATAATLPPTTITATTTAAAEATATPAAVAALASAGAPSGSAVTSVVSSPIKSTPVSAALSPSHCIQSPTCTNTSSSLLAISVAETTTSVGVTSENVYKLPPLSRASSESSDLKWQTQQQSETILVNPKTGSSTSISVCGGVGGGQSGGGLLVPSAVCWEQRGRGAPPQQQLVGAEGRSGAAPLHVKACADPRPPVLGEEQRTGQEEDLTTEQEMFMQGDGWGECPAVVGSGEGGSPIDCSNGGNGGGSLELSSGSSSNSSSNPVEWAMSLDRLLADPAGVSIFIHFLKEESGCSHSLDFFFACKGLGKQSPDHLHQLLPLIWKKFIRNYSVPVSSKTHALLAEKIHGNSLSSDMFRVAQKEVYDRMKDTTYPAFLQSQAYLDQLQHYHQEQHKQLGGRMDEQHRGYQSTHLMQTPTMDIGYSKKLMSVVSESPYPSMTGGYTDKPEGFFSEQPLSGITSAAGGWTQSPFSVSVGAGALSTVYEHEISVSTASDPSSTFCRPQLPSISRPAPRGDELSESNVVAALGDIQLGLGGSNKKRLNLTPGALAATVGHRAAPLSKAGSARVTALNPYHAQYARGHHPSRHDSEGQSISSGAHTDDTRSCTDSSLDGTCGGRGGLGGGGSTSSMKQLKKQRVQMKENLRLNEELRHKQHQASLLSPRVPLEAAFVPRTQRGESPSSNLARHPEQFANLLTQKLEAVQRDRDAHERIQQAFRKIQENEGSADVYRREHAVNSLPPSLLINKIIQKIPLDDEDCGQAILDQHVSRVWQESSGESSAYSPSPPPHPHHYYPHLATNQCPGVPYPTVNNPANAACVAAAAVNATAGAALSRHQKSLGHPGSGGVGGKPITNKNFLQQQQQFVLQQQQRSKGVMEGSFPTGAPNSTPMVTTPHQMSTSKSWHQMRHREHKGPDVYSTFSSDSGNVADYCDASHRNARRHHGAGMPKARSVPEHMMDNCAGSGSERYPSSSGGSRGRGPSLTADLTDSGVSVISGSRPSLLTPSNNSSSVKQRVETWLADSTESSHKLSSSCGSVRGTADLQPVLAQADRSMHPHNRRGASLASSCVSSKLQQQQFTGPGVGSAQDPARRRHRGNGAGGDPPGRIPLASAAVVTATMMAGAPVHGGDATPGSTAGTTVQATGGNGGGITASATTGNGGTINTTTGGSGGNSDRNTSSSNGSTMRKQHRSSAKHGGGGSDSQSSCGRSSDSAAAESTTVVYSFCDDSVPFVIKIPARSITLRRFKHHLPKRGNYRFFFKKHCEEFNGVIQEEMTEDDEVLPLYEGRIFAQIRKAD